MALFPDYASIRNLDFSSPLSLPGSTSVDEEALGFITAMGFTRNQAIKALKATVSIKRSSSRIGQENMRSGQSKTRTLNDSVTSPASKNRALVPSVPSLFL